MPQHPHNLLCRAELQIYPRLSPLHPSALSRPRLSTRPSPAPLALSLRIHSFAAFCSIMHSSRTGGGGGSGGGGGADLARIAKKVSKLRVEGTAGGHHSFSDGTRYATLVVLATNRPSAPSSDLVRPRATSCDIVRQRGRPPHHNDFIYAHHIATILTYVHFPAPQSTITKINAVHVPQRGEGCLHPSHQ